jgi:hypothetical protein
MIRRTLSSALSLLIASSGVGAGEPVASAHAAQPLTSTVVSLDGDGWLLATDPKDVGRKEERLLRNLLNFGVRL